VARRLLAAGEVHLMLGTPFELASPIAAGAVPLALTASARVANLPGVPTFAELGLQGMQVSHWFGLVTPAGTPGRTIAALYTATAMAMASPEVAGALSLQGMSVAAADPGAFADFLKIELDRWSGVVRQAGITADDVADAVR
jgi:tripartite-type tricarboxylate transporter receptor subunit TctC